MKFFLALSSNHAQKIFFILSRRNKIEMQNHFLHFEDDQQRKQNSCAHNAWQNESSQLLFCLGIVKTMLGRH